MLNNLSTISNCGVQQEEEISFMIQFLIFWGGEGVGGGCKAWTKGTNRKIIFKSIVQWLILSLFKCKFCLCCCFIFALKDMFRLEKIEKKKEYTAEHIFKPMYG